MSTIILLTIVTIIADLTILTFLWLLQLLLELLLLLCLVLLLLRLVCHLHESLPAHLKQNFRYTVRHVLNFPHPTPLPNNNFMREKRGLICALSPGFESRVETAAVVGGPQTLSHWYLQGLMLL